MAQLPSNPAAIQAAAPPSDPEAGDSLPSDLMTLELEDLMGLQVGSRAEPDRDGAPRDRGWPAEVLPATGAPGATPGVAAGRPTGTGDLPADLTALSLAQLMTLPLRRPQRAQEEEPEVADDVPGDGAEDGEALPAVVQTQADRGSEAIEVAAAPPPPAAAGAAFSAPDLDGDAGAGPEGPAHSLARAAPRGADPLEGTVPPGTAGTVRFAALPNADDDAAPNSAAAFSASDTGAKGDGSGNLTLIGGAGNDSLTGNAGADTLSGNAGQDSLLGGAGDDRLDGGSGKDTLSGGGGDDILVWDKADGIIDGGDGLDTLLADGGDIDLTAYSGTITSIEQVEMSGDGADTSLTLDAQDVLDMSSTDTLTLSGDVGDSVEAGSDWTDGGVVGAVHVYTLGLATLEVGLDITVNLDIAS